MWNVECGMWGRVDLTKNEKDLVPILSNSVAAGQTPII